MKVKGETYLGSISYEEYFDEFICIENLKQAAKVWVKEDIRRLNKLQAENKKLRDALGFYADENNWFYECCENFSYIRSDDEEEIYDSLMKTKTGRFAKGGKRARKTLSEINNNKESEK